VVLQQSRAVETVVLRTVSYGATDCAARKRLIVYVLPTHRQWSEMPLRTAWYTGTVGICFLMTTRTIQSGYALAFWTANDVAEMTVAIIALLRVIRPRMAVDAARVRQD
jgi:hypothetical protein